MKRLLKLILIFFAALGLGSCDLNDDGYSLGKYWVDFGLIASGDGGSNFTIHVDEGHAIIPVNMSQINTEKWTNDTRVIVNYTIVGDKDVDGEEKVYYAKINDLRKVLYKGVLDLTPEITDSIGNDPITVDKVWVKDHMLNFRLYYFGNTEVHYINLVKEPGAVATDEQPLELELRHNENKDQRAYRMSAYVTFDMRSLQVAGKDSIQFVVKATGYDGKEYSYEGAYKY